MNIPQHFSSHLSLSEKVLYVLSLLKKATADEVTTEIMELQGTATEEGVADLTIATTEALNHLQCEGLLKMETESDKQTRFKLNRSF